MSYSSKRFANTRPRRSHVRCYSARNSMNPKSAASSTPVSSSILSIPSVIEPHYRRSELNDLPLPNITPAHLSSWNPPKPDILYTVLGMLPTYRTLSSWKPPNQSNTTQNIYKRAPFLPLSSAQVPCPSSSANCCPISPRSMHRRLPLKSAQATTTANTRMCES